MSNTTVVRMKLNKTTKEPYHQPADGKFQHSLELATEYTSDKNDPNYIFGCLSSGSTMLLKTINDEAVAGFEPGDVLEITIRKVQETTV